MTHFLRTKDNKSIVDIDAWKDDLSAVVIIDEYSKFLLDNLNRKEEIIEDFYLLSEIRGEYHETPNQTETPDELVGRRVKEIGKKYDLAYVTD